LSPNESYPQHVVTAVIVAHDGAAWLPHVADALLKQTRPVQRVVAVDTGSRDRSGAVLAAKFGQSAVFGMDRGTGYGAAIARALHHRAANVPIPGSSAASAQDRTEWLWLLHDDCEPAADALEQLLRGVEETSGAAVLGPKLRDWANREVVLEAGVTLDTAARRLTGIEPREVDQGQHDGDRDALAVSSAGMLVRRDVWDQVGGFDTAMGLFMEDIDFCWRVHAAGYRVRVITDAIAYHMQAATRHRRAVSVGRRAPMLDRRNGLLTLLGNLPFRQMVTSAAGNVVVSLLRITFFMLAKRLIAAVDEAAALTAALGHPLRLMSMRRRRVRGRRSAYSRIRADLPAGRSFRRLMEFAASAVLKSAQTDTAGSHHASADPTDDDSLLVDNIGLARRLLTSPVVLTFVVLLGVALAAGRTLLGSGPIGGGALVPAWGGAADLWHGFLQGFHPSGIGSTSAEPPYLAVLAALATLLGGKPWLAIDVILLGCVPLAAMSAMLAARRVTKLAAVRVWAAASYGLLPVAMGVVAGGRFGSAVVFIVLPIIALLSGRIVTSGRQQARRAAWASGLLVAIGAMFVPLLSLVALLACVLTALIWRNTRPGQLTNLVIAGLTAPVLLLPWTLALIAHPAELLLEAGLARPGFATAGVPARSLLLISPGGPGMPPFWVTAGLLFAALAALLAGRRRRLIMAGWGIALSGLLLAVVVSRLTVIPVGGGQPVAVWAGFPLALAAIGLLLAAMTGAEALARMLAGRKGWRGLVSGRAALATSLAFIACSAPVLAATWWIATGISGPVRPATSQLLPELVAMADGQGRQVRTLVLRMSGGHVSYLLLREPSPSLADIALSSPAAASNALRRAVAALIAPGGGGAVNQSQLLADLDIGYVLMQTPVDERLAGLLDDVAGLRPYSTTSRYDLWQLETPPARVTVVGPSGTVVPVSSGPVSVSGVQAPAAGGTLMLAEPTGGWRATLNGTPLTQVRSPAGSWAQAFRLPAGGGTLSISHADFWHDLGLVLQALALLVLIALALPGIHLAEVEGQHAGVGRAGAGRDLAADADLDSSAGSDDLGVAERPGKLAAAVGSRVPDRAAQRGGRGRSGAAQPGLGRAGAKMARAKAGRRGKAGVGKSAGGNAGVGKAGRGTAAAVAAGGRAAASARRSAWPDTPAGNRGARLPDAWPYAAGDEPDDRAEELAGSESASLADRGYADSQVGDRAAAWPHQAGDEPDDRRAQQLDSLPARSAGQTRADQGTRRRGVWPHPASDEPDDQRSVPRRGLPDPRWADHDTDRRPGVWPYPAGSDTAQGAGHLDTGRRAGTGTGGGAGFLPYGADDDLGSGRTAERAGASAGFRSDLDREASRSGAWPYPAAGDREELDGRRPRPDRSGDERTTGERPAIRPDRPIAGERGSGQHALPPGRSPSGRTLSGEWPRPAAGDEMGADRHMSLPARSPSGWVPPPDQAADDDSQADRSGRAGTPAGPWPYADERRPGRPDRRTGRFDRDSDGRDGGPQDADQPPWPGNDQADRPEGGRLARRDRDRQDRRGGDRPARRGGRRAGPREADDADRPLEQPAGRRGGDWLGRSGSRRPGQRDENLRERADDMLAPSQDPPVRADAGRPSRSDGGRLGRLASGQLARRAGHRADRSGAERPDGRGPGQAASWDSEPPDGYGDRPEGRGGARPARSAGRSDWLASEPSGRPGGDRPAGWAGGRPGEPADRSDRRDTDRPAGPGSDRSRRPADERSARPGGDRGSRWDGDRRDSGELARWDSGGADRRDSGELARWDSGRADRRPTADGRAARDPYGAAGRPTAGGQAPGWRGAEPSAGWPGGGDSLEPLPPPVDSGRVTPSRSTWRPAAGRQDTTGNDAGRRDSDRYGSGGYGSGAHDSGPYASGQYDSARYDSGSREPGQYRPRWDEADGGGQRPGRRSADREPGRRSAGGRGRDDGGWPPDAGVDRYGVDAAGERWPAPDPEPEYEGEGW
jgi:GT2 family glycosyltransferase